MDGHPHDYRGSPKGPKVCKVCNGYGFVGDAQCECGSEGFLTRFPIPAVSQRYFGPEEE